ncbi:unnamed protein product, partial [Symbiodinium pilosum]
MATYSCSTIAEWKELVDITCMTRNRLLLRACFPQSKKLWGYTPRLPGGQVDCSAAATMTLLQLTFKKLATLTPVLRGCERQPLVPFTRRTVTKFFEQRLAGRRKFQNFDAGIRVASEEESLSISDWLDGITQAPEAFEKIPKRNFVDCSQDTDPIDVDGEMKDYEPSDNEGIRHDPPEDPPGPRVRRKMATYARPRDQLPDLPDDLPPGSDFVGADDQRLQRAISKQIRNNLLTGAHELLPPQASDQVLKNKSDKVMNSRYVLTKRPLEAFEVDGVPAEDILLGDAGFGPKKAKYRHGFSSPSALDVESTTPQVQRESVIFVAQVLASMSWIPGFLDFTQAFHSGDKIATECIVVKLQKDFWHQVSQFDPCVLYLKIATEYKLGKNQKGGQIYWDIKLELDGSIRVNDKVIINQITLERKQQRSSKCTAAELVNSVFSWLSKETRCDLAGRVALLQQAFPDLIEGNKIAAEAIKHADLGIRVMPIPWDQLWVSVVTDASWGYSKDKLWLEDSCDDYWEETEKEWIQHHAGRIVIYHDSKLAYSEEPSMTTAAWRSYRLKRNTADTLLAEGQALQWGLGVVRWHRMLFLEAFHGMLSAADWKREAGKLPVFAAVDSKSLYNALSKCSSTVAYASDKQTAIDLSIIKSDLADTCGKIRWIDTRSMISDPLI